MGREGKGGGGPTMLEGDWHLPTDPSAGMVETSPEWDSPLKHASGELGQKEVFNDVACLRIGFSRS